MNLRARLLRFSAGRSAAPTPARDASGRARPPRGLPRGLFCAALAAQALLGCVRNDVPAEPVTWDLTPEAELSYGTLLLDQSLRHNDREGVLEAASVLLSVETRAQPFVDAAAWLVLNKENGEARRLLEKAIPRVPDEVALRLLLAETWINQGDAEQASRVLEDCERAFPDSLMARQEIGVLYVRIERFRDADRVFSSLPQKMRTPFVRYAHAQALRGLNRPKQAVRELRLAVKDRPDFLDAWFDMARILEQEKAYAEASKIYADLLEKNPGSEDVWLRLVDGEIKAGRAKRALELAKEGPDAVDFRLAAVGAFLDAGLFREAEILLSDLKARPDAPDEAAFYLAIVAFEARKNVQETLDRLAAVPETSRYFGRALRWRVQLLHEAGRRSEALALIHRGQRLFPEERDFRLMEAHVLLAGDENEEALTAVETALALWPDDENFLYMRGLILDSMGKKNEAFRLMERLAAASPDFAPALNYVGYSLAEQGKDLDRALDLLRRAVELAPGRGYVLDSLAWAQFRKGLTDEAWATISKAVVLPDGDDAVIWEHYGDVAAAQGRREEARKGWERALGLKHPQPDVVRKKLEAL